MKVFVYQQGRVANKSLAEYCLQKLHNGLCLGADHNPPSVHFKPKRVDFDEVPVGDWVICSLEEQEADSDFRDTVIDDLWGCYGYTKG